MGMIGEALAAAEAEKLERILSKIADDDNILDRKCSKCALDPVNLDLIHWYLSACSEGFVQPNYALLGRFENYTGSES